MSPATATPPAPGATGSGFQPAPGEAENCEPVADEAEHWEIGQRAWRSLQLAHAALAKRVDAELERTHSLPLTSYEVLHRLVESPGGRMRMCDLAEQSQLSRSGLTRLADRLEKDGLLERCTCEHDARGSYACLTELGRERFHAARVTHVGVVREQLLSRFSADELGALAEMWERI
ncbi:MAG TPA: MarR family transcriptional regulator, partial [Solirubrobacteraceae bacterium]|nr:MarR family transcriptional regulator [Solirubrobacteraceae bacterium]